jgi:predicted phage terminase large subunit-like protein
MDFPELKRAVRELAAMHRADIVLVEDKASGISLIQELRAEGFSRVQASPSLDGDKVMRLRAQTAKIEGGFVIFPEEAPWLDAYLRELLSFPNSKNDDQVDSTVYALAWITVHPEPGILGYYSIQANAQLQRSNQNKNTRVFIPPGPSHWEINGRSMLIPESRILQVTDEEARIMIGNGCRRIE